MRIAGASANPGCRIYVQLASVLVVCALFAALPAMAGVTVRVNVSEAGTEANNYAWSPAVTPDGRYIAYDSKATNLVPGDTNSVYDAFLLDRATNTLSIVSIPAAASRADRHSGTPALSADARYVVFESQATNMVPYDRNNVMDIFIRDRQQGTTKRISVSNTGEEGNAISANAAISHDGRYVAFESDASNLVPGDRNGYADIFLYDVQQGTISLVSVAANGGPANNSSRYASISADGRYIAYASAASNLVPGDTNGCRDAFVYDRIANTTTRVSVSSSGVQGNNYTTAGRHSVDISSDGRFVVFESKASNLVSGDTNGKIDIFVHDCTTGETTRVSVKSDGRQVGSDNFYPCISGDGRYVAFQGFAAFVPEDTNTFADIYVHDQVTGETFLASISSDGIVANERSGANYGGPVMNEDGRLVLFQSYASNLVPRDTNAIPDIFMRETAGSAQPGLTPDLMFVRDGSYLGDNIYGDAEQQTLSQVVSLGGRARYVMRVENEGSEDAEFTITGGASVSGWQVAYYTEESGGTAITSQVTGDGATLTVPAGGSILFRCEVTNTANVSQPLQMLVSVGRADNMVVADTVRIVTALPLAAVKLTATPSAAPIGTPVMLSATSVGGANVEYQFWVRKNWDPYVLLQDFSTNSLAVWTPALDGDYTLMVYGREKGTTTTKSAYIGFTVGAPISSATLTVSPSTTVALGGSLTLTVTATGGNRLEYKFWAGRLVNGVYVGKDLCLYSANNTYVWTPDTAGTYQVVGLVREVGSAKAYDAYAIVYCTVTGSGTGSTGTTLTAAPDTTVTLGQPITLTVTASGSNLEYKFWAGRSVDGRWIGADLCRYSPVNTLIWAPSIAGTYQVVGLAREVGSANAYDTYAILYCTINSP